MKLTPTQIQQLYKFTRVHYVEHYDVQTELVDHLANGIELQWQKHSQRSYDQALQIEFKKFGVFGFQDVITEKQKAVTKKYHKLIGQFVKEWFRFPKLLSTITATLVVFSTLRYLNQIDFKKEIVLGTIFCFTLAVLTYFLVTRKNRKLKMEKNGKKFMLSEMIHNFEGTIAFYYMPFNFLNLSEESFFHSFHFDLVFSIALITGSVIFYVMFFVIPSKAEALLEEAYQEYKMPQ